MNLESECLPVLKYSCVTRDDDMMTEFIFAALILPAAFLCGNAEKPFPFSLLLRLRAVIPSKAISYYFLKAAVL